MDPTHGRGEHKGCMRSCDRMARTPCPLMHPNRSRREHRLHARACACALCSLGHTSRTRPSLSSGSLESTPKSSNHHGRAGLDRRSSLAPFNTSKRHPKLKKSITAASVFSHCNHAPVLSLNVCCKLLQVARERLSICLLSDSPRTIPGVGSSHIFKTPPRMLPAAKHL